MSLHTLCLCAGILNFGGFAWGMAAHFRKVGANAPAMKLTALLAAICTALQVYALVAIPPWHPAAALVFYTLSAGLYWYAIANSRGKLAACGQGIVSPQLIGSGPYRFIRHPFYTAYDLTWMAGMIATGWPPLALTVAVMAAIYERSAREEENGFLAGPLAAKYRAYKLRAGRYLPWVRGW